MNPSTSIGFIGGGRIATILLGGLARAGHLPQSVVVSDPDQAVLERLSRLHPSVQTTHDNHGAAAQDIIFLAVHPPLASLVLPETAPAFQSAAAVISLLPKLTFEKLQSLASGFNRFVRMIPNAPSIIGKGYNPLAFSAGVSPESRKLVRELCGAWGTAPEVPEYTLEAYAILTAMGPTYFWPQLYELAQLGEQFGLSPGDALTGIQHMLAGTADIMLEAGLSPEDVQDLIPVKPLKDDQAAILEAYRTRLPALMNKIRP